MNYLEILHSFGNEIKSKLRKLENIQIKIINTTWSHTFNDVCLRENKNMYAKEYMIKII